MSEEARKLVKKVRALLDDPTQGYSTPLDMQRSHMAGYWEKYTPELCTLIEQQAARIAELEKRTYHYIGRDGKTVTAAALEDRAEAAEAEVKRLREALAFYANPEIYKPHPHGSAFDKRHTLGFVAEAALATQEPRHD